MRSLMVTTEAELLAKIEVFLSVTGMAPSRFGLDCLGDGALVLQLRKQKRSLTLRSADRILQFIEQHPRRALPDRSDE